MTKIEIIRELSRIRFKFVKSLYVIYHSPSTNARYVYSYEYTSHLSLESRREFDMVVSSLYKLRKYIESIRVVYFPFDEENEDPVICYSTDVLYVHSIQDFIKHIKPVKK